MRKLLKTSMRLAVFTMMLLSGCAAHHINMAPKVPEPLKVPEHYQLVFALRGVGTQIYACKAVADDPARLDWTFIAPEAVLLDNQGNKVGKHYAGPTWQANDGSKVVGEVMAKDNGPDPAAIPWLLLRTKATAGTGIFSQITSVQRLNTRGGKAPAGGCSQAEAGTEVRIPYTADYYFYSARH